MAIDKTCDLVGRTYWPGLYGEVTIYIWGWGMPDPEQKTVDAPTGEDRYPELSL